MVQTADYGNWMPRNILYFIGTLTIILIIPSLFTNLLFIKIIFWALTATSLLSLTYLIYLYRVFSTNDKELQNKCWQLVIDKLPWNGEGKALDIGTGAGPLAIKLAKKNLSSKIWGIDYWGKIWNYSKMMCENNAKLEGVSDRVIFQKASASNLPFDDQEFDAIVSNNVFHEVRTEKDKKVLFKEAFRVLKKGGAFSIQDVFVNNKQFGKIEEIINTIKEWGIQEIHLIKTTDEVEMPVLIKRGVMKKSGLIYGIK